jgi:D-3-phosphoglycerate dehydrogenase
MKGEWDYTNYIGRQMNMLNIGVLGYGRLGSLYAHYSKSFGANVYVLDPYIEIKDEGIKQLDSLKELSQVSDILSIHVHVNEETKGMINYRILSEMKNDVTIINTSRGEIINETDLVGFLKENNSASFATDVLTDEIRNRKDSPILNYAKENPDQVTITQHIGGMTREAQTMCLSSDVWGCL